MWTLFTATFIIIVCIQVYWHSSAHILGEAMEKVYGGCLCYGPPIENGFYYDMFLENEWVSVQIYGYNKWRQLALYYLFVYFRA